MTSVRERSKSKTDEAAGTIDHGNSVTIWTEISSALKERTESTLSGRWVISIDSNKLEEKTAA
jgi:hypothetical protein